MSKSERRKFRLGFLFLLVLTLSFVLFVGYVKVLRYWKASPLVNLDRPLLLNPYEDVVFQIRLKNLGEYQIEIQDVQLQGTAFQWGAKKWTVTQTLPAKSKEAYDAILSLNLVGRSVPQAEPITIIVFYRYGWFRHQILLPIKTELPSP